VVPNLFGSVPYYIIAIAAIARPTCAFKYSVFIYIYFSFQFIAKSVGAHGNYLPPEQGRLYLKKNSLKKNFMKKSNS
jgi:hypothetical protein